MPVKIGKYRTLLSDFTPFPTIPLVYLYDLYHIYRQIIDENLYTTLLASDITWELLSTGDFLIHAPAALQELEEEIRIYRGEPPLPSCIGQSLLVSYIAAKSHELTSTINADLIKYIESLCYGSTTIKTFNETIKNILQSNIETELNKFIE